MTEQKNTASGFLGGLFAGALIGAGIALLLAPKRGEELREDLAHNANEWTSTGATALADRAQELKEQASRVGKTVAQKAQELKQKGQDRFAEGEEIVADKIEDVKEAVED